MEIRKVPISLLNAAPYNPRKDLQPGDPEYQKIARSIEKYSLFLFLHKKCRPPLTASCSVRSVFRLPV